MRLGLPEGVRILDEAVRLYGVQMLLQECDAATPAADETNEEAEADRPFYCFGGGAADGDGTRKAVLGGKGAGLAEMARAGVPVPPGFTLPTDLCRRILTGETVELTALVRAALDDLEARVGHKLGDGLMVSVRSGARVSMPGMMETVLNVGSVPGTPAHRRFVEMYARVVSGWTQAMVDCADPAQLLLLAPNPMPALVACVQAVFQSWNTARARLYRQAHGYSNEWGTACTVQAMVMGLGPQSGTGVLFTRDPKTGEPGVVGEYLADAQGEDVVAGTRTPQPLSALRDAMPEVHAELVGRAKDLELHFRDMQDVEFTVEAGRLWLLQTRAGKRSARAMVRIAVDLAREGVVTREEACRRIDLTRLAQVTLPAIAEPRPVPMLTGIGAAPGVATGRVVATVAEAVTARELGELVVYYSPDTKPEDLPAMMAAVAVVTATGGKTCHAAVVALGLGKPCVVGTSQSLAANQLVTVDGASGEVFAGAVPVTQPEPDDYVQELEAWMAATPAGRFRAQLQKILDGQVRRLDAMFRLYVLAAVIGELRHVQGCMSPSEKKAEIVEKLRQYGLSQGGRRTAVQNRTLARMLRVASRRELVDLAVEAYSLPGWRGSYGGAKWANIATTLRERFAHLDTKGKTGLPPAVWVDAVFDLQHNGGAIFDKRKEIVFSKCDLQRFLNAKREAATAAELAKWVVQVPDVRELFLEAQGFGLRPAPMKAMATKEAMFVPAIVVKMQHLHCSCGGKVVEAVLIPR